MIALLFLTSTTSAEETPTPGELLSAVDHNLVFESRSTKATMRVVKPKRTKEYTLMSYGRGADEAATEFLSPARDAGTKMLKRGDEMWMYLPSIEKVQKLSGHMLRQGMMGSDISYEDMMESSSWQDMYTASVTGQDTFEDRPCWVVEMIATDESVAYPKRVVCVDAENKVPVRQELYAVSGMLLKVWTMHDAKQYGDRWYPSRMKVEDKLQEGTYTEMIFEEMSFSVELEDEVFSQRWLER
ncbi:MAG: outer membrane lipoprotein-sorting protein [Proteobacteria bacterium]|nr:outer membrane lipoprotein-sorting protein [Pseudomonadota bacterium]MCP4919826.1 outer membrane lipoprotein-sorting protein [Pseudomonadota bacterium]